MLGHKLWGWMPGGSGRGRLSLSRPRDCKCGGDRSDAVGYITSSATAGLADRLPSGSPTGGTAGSGDPSCDGCGFITKIRRPAFPRKAFMKYRLIIVIMMILIMIIIMIIIIIIII